MRNIDNGKLGAIMLVLMLIGGSLLSMAVIGAPGDVDSRAGSRAITKAPYLQNVTTDRLTICWETDTPGSSVVDYGPTTAYGSTVNGPLGVTFHEVTLTGLAENTTYHYQVTTGTDSSQDATFKTAVPLHGAFMFAALGDTRTDHVAHQNVMNRLDTFRPELVLNSGDLVATGSSQADWDAFFVDAGPVLNHTPYYPAVGNHDLPGALYMHYFSLPHNERYYSFDHGSVHFISLDTNLQFSQGSAQYNWLIDDLDAANDTADWKFVMFHHPAYSSSSHGSTTTVQTHLVPIMEQYKVDAVFTGHDHNYEHALVNGVHYFVTGGGGAPLYGNGTSSWTVYSESVHHFMLVNISEQKAHFRGVRTDGTIFDEFDLTKPDVKPPMPVTVRATDTGLGGSVDLDWTGYNETLQRDVAGYRLYRSTTNFTDVGAMAFEQSFPSGTFTARVEGLQNETEYFFAITAIDEVPNEGQEVVAANATPTDKIPPAQPVGLTFVEATYTSLNLSWDANTEPDLDGYDIFMNRSDTGSGGPYDLIDTVNSTTLGHNATGLVQNTTYCFVLQAFDNASIPNNSTYSAEACTPTLAVPVNRPPRAIQKVSELFFLEDPVAIKDRSYDISVLFKDPDLDDLTYSIDESDLVTWLDTNITDKALVVFEFPENWTGQGTVNVSASDGEYSDWAHLRVTVMSINDAPIMVLPRTWNVLQDTNTTLEVTRYDAEDLPEELYTDTDLAQRVPGAVAGMNLWIDHAAGNITFLPDNDMVGEYDINITVTDTLGLTQFASLKVVIENVNDPPEITGVAPESDLEIEVNTSIRFSVVATDPDLRHDDRLSYTWSTNVTGPFGYGSEVTYTLPIGIYNVSLTVEDQAGLMDTHHFKVTVFENKDVPPPPPPPPPPTPGNGDGPGFFGWLWVPCIMIIVILVVIIVVVILMMRQPSRPPLAGPVPPPMYGPYQAPPPGYQQVPPPEAYGPQPTTVGPSGLPSEPEGAAQSSSPEVADDWEVIAVEEGPTEVEAKEEDLDDLITKLKEDEGKQS